MVQNISFGYFERPVFYLNHFFKTRYDADGEPTKGDFQAGVTSQEEEKFAIRVDDFHLHVQQMKQQDYFGFREEFLLLPDGQKFPCTVAQHTVNRVRGEFLL